MNKDVRSQHREALWIRFIGENLETRSIPIYELGQTLISVQQIIYKAYLHKEGRLQKRPGLAQWERELLALQISSHRKDSDAYGLIPYLLDPSVQELVNSLVAEVLVALGAYTLGKVISKIRESRKGRIEELEGMRPDEIPRGDISQHQMYIASIFRQVFNIVRRIDSIGDVKAIEMSTTIPDARVLAVMMDGSTKQYVMELRHEFFLGEYQEIEGVIIRLYPGRNMVVVRVVPNGSVSVLLRRDDFERIRYEAGGDTVVNFKGRPRFRFGMETFKFDEFEAYSVDF